MFIDQAGRATSLRAFPPPSFLTVLSTPLVSEDCRSKTYLDMNSFHGGFESTGWGGESGTPQKDLTSAWAIQGKAW